MREASIKKYTHKINIEDAQKLFEISNKNKENYNFYPVAVEREDSKGKVLTICLGMSPKIWSNPTGFYTLPIYVNNIPDYY